MQSHVNMAIPFALKCIVRLHYVRTIMECSHWHCGQCKINECVFYDTWLALFAEWCFVTLWQMSCIIRSEMCRHVLFNTHCFSCVSICLSWKHCCVLCMFRPPCVWFLHVGISPTFAFQSFHLMFVFIALFMGLIAVLSNTYWKKLPY